MVASLATVFPATSAGCTSAKHAFLEVFTEDLDARETLLATFYNNSTFAKQSETSVADHEVHISKLCDCIDMLPRPANMDNLSSINRHTLFYNTFQKTWREEYTRCNVMTSKTTQQQIRNICIKRNALLTRSTNKPKSRTPPANKTKRKTAEEEKVERPAKEPYADFTEDTSGKTATRIPKTKIVPTTRDAEAAVVISTTEAVDVVAAVAADWRPW